MNIGQLVEVLGNKFVASGLCLSRTLDGEIVFVDGLIPGEKANIQITSTRRGTSFGEIVELIERSPNRVTPPCPYVKKGCGGCGWQHIDVKQQSIYKTDIVVDSLERIAKVNNIDEVVAPIVCLAKDRYRISARVFFKSQSWGFYKRNSHEIVPIENCMILDEECVALSREECISSLSGLDPLDSTNVRFDLQASQTEKQVRIKDIVFKGVELKVSPKSFYQSHRDAPEVLSNLILDAIDDLGENLLCVDLYCGVGIFSLALAKCGHEVIGVEGNKSACSDAKENLEDYKAQIICCDIKDYRFKSKRNCDVVVADPPRSGVARDGLKALLSCKAKRIVLISCDPASGARDIFLLTNNGYKLDKVIPIDMFGHTHHVEMVSVLAKF